MAIKKCDDITEEGVVQKSEETTTGSGFETQPSTQSGVESQSLAQQSATMVSQTLSADGIAIA